MIAAEPERVWELISDPHSLPRWWPRTRRVEDVRTASGGTLAWTKVLETEKGRGVRADFRRIAEEPGRTLAWAQEIEGTPFERVLRASALEISVAPEGGASEGRLTADETLRGLSRLGSPMITSAARRRLDDALAGIERALVEA